VLPLFLRQVASSRSREVFFLTAIVICLGTAWIGNQLGLSLAIGAFFAGFMFANTDYGHQLIGDIVPFRHVFVSIFFVSIGLLFDIQFTLANIPLIMTVVGLVLIINFVVMALLLVCFGFSPRVSMAAGIILCQMGEFSFILLEGGRSVGGIDQFLYQILLSTAFITMLMTPFLFSLVPIILRLSENLPMLGVHPAEWKKGKGEEKEGGHIILCGFGPCGRDLAQTFEEEKIPFILLEMNPSKIKHAKEQKLHVIYGDATNREVMHRAGIRQARAVIVSFSDPIGLAQIIRVVQNLNPDTLLVVRTRFEREVAHLYELGADIVVMEEWETSHELNRVLLNHFEIPEEKIKHHLERIRARKELVIEQAIFKRHHKQ